MSIAVHSVAADVEPAASWHSHAAQLTCELVDLLAVPEPAWTELAPRAAEPNAFYHPAWAIPAAMYADRKGGARALLAWDGPARSRLIAILPVVWAWSALKIPFPALVAWDGYAPLRTPLIDRDRLDDATRGLLRAAALAGAGALMLPGLPREDAIASALRRAVASFGGHAFEFNRHSRARLDATQDAEIAIRSLGSKKVKELRRQRRRLADTSAVECDFVAGGAEASAAVEQFLGLEASGWKGSRGTALAKKNGDAAFVRAATAAMMAQDAAEVAVLKQGGRPIASGIVLRHQRRGFFFKIAYDEAFAQSSPGVQLTLDITRRLCDDARVDDVDSTASADHPMIDHIWRSRLAVSDLVLPVRPGSFAPAMFAALVGVRAAARDVAQVIRSLKGKKS